MMKDRFKPFAAVYLLFIRDGKILMIRRAGTGYQDGMYSLPAGHIDGGETLKAAAMRETKEEIGIETISEDLELRLVMHRIHAREYIDFFFLAKKWQGEPQNREPHKCNDVGWFPLGALPANTISYVSEAIRCFQNGVPYWEFGWGERADIDVSL